MALGGVRTLSFAIVQKAKAPAIARRLTHVDSEGQLCLDTENQLTFRGPAQAAIPNLEAGDCVSYFRDGRFIVAAAVYPLQFEEGKVTSNVPEQVPGQTRGKGYIVISRLDDKQVVKMATSVYEDYIKRHAAAACNMDAVVSFLNVGGCAYLPHCRQLPTGPPKPYPSYTPHRAGDRNFFGQLLNNNQIHEIKYIDFHGKPVYAESSYKVTDRVIKDAELQEGMFVKFATVKNTISYVTALGFAFASGALDETSPVGKRSIAEHWWRIKTQNAEVKLPYQDWAQYRKTAPPRQEGHAYEFFFILFGDVAYLPHWRLAGVPAGKNTSASSSRRNSSVAPKANTSTPSPSGSPSLSQLSRGLNARHFSNPVASTGNQVDGNLANPSNDPHARGRSLSNNLSALRGSSPAPPGGQASHHIHRRGRRDVSRSPVRYTDMHNEGSSSKRTGTSTRLTRIADYLN